MTAVRIAPAMAGALALSGCASFGPQPASPAQAMAGRWTVDLRPELDAPPYSQPMELQIARDGSVSGNFYNSPILAGEAGTGQGRSCVAFRTSDNSGPYHTSACLDGDRLVGQTWSEGRGFMQPWTGERD